MSRYSYPYGKPRRDRRFPFAVAGVLVAVALAGLFVVPRLVGVLGDAGAGATPTPVPTPRPLPACEIGDVPAADTSYDDWDKTLLDTSFRLDASYVPPDLAPVTGAGLAGSAKVRSFVIPDLGALVDAAQVDGLDPQVNSAYRSFAEQGALYSETLRKYGEEWARTSAAQAGHSEHQLGTAVDFGGAMGAWLTAHAWEYGFVNSFPTDSSPAKTCYKPELWHVRYVGRDTARAIHDSGLSPREWLWSHYLAKP